MPKYKLNEKTVLKENIGEVIFVSDGTTCWKVYRDDVGEYSFATKTYRNTAQSPTRSKFKSKTESVFVPLNDVEQGGQELTLEEILMFYQYKTRVANAAIAIRLGFLRKVYGLLTMQLLITIFIGAMFMFVPPIQEFLERRVWVILVSFIGTPILLVPLYYLRKKSPANFIFLVAYTVSQAITIGIIVSFYPKIIVLKAFVMIFVVLASLAIYSCQSKYDFSGWYSGLFAALLILIGGSLMQLYVWSSVHEMIFAFSGALLFCIYTIADLQFIMRKVSPEEYILATITLYTDILNLFLYVLRLLAIFSE